jgi:hypothetical protein
LLGFCQDECPAGADEDITQELCGGKDDDFAEIIPQQTPACFRKKALIDEPNKGGAP